MAQDEKARVSVAKRVVDETEQTVTFKFSNGSTLVAKLAEVPGMVTRLALHGLSQKLGDPFAGAKGDVALAFGLASDAYGALKQNQWSERGKGEEEGPTIICEAIARAHGKDLNKVVAAWAKLDEKIQKALRSDPAVKTAMAEIRLERAKKAAAAAAAVAVDVSVFD